MISIIDYGMGNLRSVQKAFESIGIKAVVTSDKDTILNSRGIILPGVGAFPDAMDNLRKMSLDKVIRKAALDKKIPMLGICLGMQLLFEKGYEVRECEGLGLIKGTIKKIEASVKIPHMGWNNINIKKPCKILEGIESGTYYYFVHSFYADAENEENVNATAYYGMDVTAAVSSGNIYGTQFHPEKSGDVGIRILKNFGELIK